MKKQILLIQPENYEINTFRKGQFNNFVQLTMPYLAAFIDEIRYNITLVDEYNERIPYNRAFDLVALTVNTPNAVHCYDIARRFSEKGAKIVMGGPHATLLPEEVSAHCDHLLIGESEETWPQFLQGFYEGTAKKQYAASCAPPLKNLPTPRWDLVKHRRQLMKGAVIATRGCPHSCRYCNLKEIYFDTYRTRPINEVVLEISKLKSKYFVFWDDNFFADEDYALSLLEKIKPLKKKWAAQVTISDCKSDRLLQAARDAGCLYLFVGLESFSPPSLQDAGKSINRADTYKELIKKLHAHKIMVQAGIVFGFDSDTKSVFDDTLNACETLGIDGVTASLLTPFPKTPVYNQLKKEHRLKSENWTQYNSKTHVTFNPKNMTAEELYAGYMAFRKGFYSLPSIRKRLRISKTNLLVNLLMNLGYRHAIK